MNVEITDNSNGTKWYKQTKTIFLNYIPIFLQSFIDFLYLDFFSEIVDLSQAVQNILLKHLETLAFLRH